MTRRQPADQVRRLLLYITNASLDQRPDYTTSTCLVNVNSDVARLQQMQQLSLADPDSPVGGNPPRPSHPYPPLPSSFPYLVLSPPST